MVSRVWAAGALALLAGCSGHPDVVARPPGGAVIRIHGSTTVGPAAADLAREFMLRYPGVTVLWPGEQAVAHSAPSTRYDAERAQAGESPLWHDWLGSEWAPRLLAAGEIDVGGMSRMMKADEMEYSRRAGAPLRAYKIASDALVLFCHPSRGEALRGITQQQAAAIFLTGEITHWDQLDPALKHDEIVPWSRNPLSSGTGNAFVELVDPAHARRFEGAERYAAHVRYGEPDDINAAVAQDPNAIGYNSFGRIGTAPVWLLPFATDTPGAPRFVKPTKASFLNGSYALQRPVFLVAKGMPTGDVNRFIQFALSPRGQEIMRAHELVTVR